MDQLPAWAIDSSNIWLIGQPQKEEILRQCCSLLPRFSRGFSQDSNLKLWQKFPFVSQCLCCVLGFSTTYSFWIASWWWWVNGLCTTCSSFTRKGLHGRKIQISWCVFPCVFGTYLVFKHFQPASHLSNVTVPPALCMFCILCGVLQIMWKCKGVKTNCCSVDYFKNSSTCTAYS